MGLSQAHDLDLSHLIQEEGWDTAVAQLRGSRSTARNRISLLPAPTPGIASQGGLIRAVKDGKEQGQRPRSLTKHSQGRDAALSFHVNEFSWNYKARTLWIRDLFYFILFLGFSAVLHPAWEAACSGRDSSRDTAGSAPHIPADTNTRAGWVLALGFLQSQAGGAALLPPHPPVFPQGWGWEPWQKALACAGMGERRKENKMLLKK